MLQFYFPRIILRIYVMKRCGTFASQGIQQIVTEKHILSVPDIEFRSQTECLRLAGAEPEKKRGGY